MRRGALRRFAKLIKASATVPVAVTWDRRTSTEPAPGGQKADRRQKPPFTWDMADFVVVGQGLEPAVSTPPTKSRKTTATATRSRVAPKKPAKKPAVSRKFSAKPAARSRKA